MNARPDPQPVNRFPMYTPEFAADPHAAYRWMRAEYGPLVPVELSPGIPATLVVAHATAVQILHDPDRFPADPRVWQQTVPGSCPIMPMVGYRPNALRSSGAAHARYRATNTDALARVPLHQLARTAQRIARQAISRICRAGQADFLAEFAGPVVFESISTTCGAPAPLAQRIGAAMAAVFEGINAEQANNALMHALNELIALKHTQPSDDIVSWLIGHHAALSGEELAEQLVTVFGAGYEPLTNLIANTQLKILTDSRFMSDVSGGSLSVREALDEGLFTDPPMANYCLSYPPHPVVIDHQVLLAHQPVVISMAACNNDPALGKPEERLGNRAHLAFSAGPHACPAADISIVIAQAALEEVLDTLPDIQLAVSTDQITWRPGPFHRALASLPVRYTPSEPLPEH
ncbi:cytochrome P450 (plasmid) [Streptomyces sp. NBC_01724]|uniref:cytochrome P450 n=1 Tax=Streptomyces sp. NBC_01724 TaxID=2975922 RepID=UPI002E338CCE|nr:cytochrome P450 [Streptomyces sp. NBC_01724]